MSQFSQKYYKHYRIEKKEVVDNVGFFVWFREESLTGSILRWLLILLLFSLLLLLMRQMFSCNTPNTPVVSVLKQATTSNTTAQESPKETVAEPDKYMLEEKIPTHVLPELSKILPKEEVTLEQYMYYVNDTKMGYPDYVDQQTNRIIKEKKPNCEKLDCPVSGIKQKDKKNYAIWLSELSQSEYKATDTPKGFKVTKP